ncbi:unnamed protein product, partial [Medioppia subpectinata]
PLEVVGDLTKTSDVNNLIDSTVKTLGKILALELGPKNIRVNTINSGLVHVRDPPSPIEILAPKYTPLGRVGQPLDIARAVAFLASTDAHFITGANVVVDGGAVFNSVTPNIPGKGQSPSCAQPKIKVSTSDRNVGAGAEVLAPALSAVVPVPRHWNGTGTSSDCTGPDRH